MSRPYITHYFHSDTDLDAAYASQGHPATEEGAIRAAVVRVFIGQFHKAVIYNRETGIPIYNIRRAGRGFRVGFGSGISFREYEEARESARSMKRSHA